MAAKNFLLQWMNNFSGEEFTLNSDQQFEDIVRRRFSVYLPQRQSFDDRLVNTTCGHEIITLIETYRAMA